MQWHVYKRFLASCSKEVDEADFAATNVSRAVELRVTGVGDYAAGAVTLEAPPAWMFYTGALYNHATTKEAAPAPANKAAGNGRLHKTRTRPGRTGARFTRATVATRTRPGRTGAHGQRSPQEQEPGRTGAHGQRSPQDKTNKHRGRNGPGARPSTSRARDGRLHPQRPGRHGRVRGRRLIPSPDSFPV